MRCGSWTVLFTLGSLILGSFADGVNPIAKVVSMIAGLQQRIVQEGEEAHKLYVEFAEMCEDRSGELHNEIKTSNSGAGELSATIDKAVADIEVLQQKISDFAAEISESEADLKEATSIRKKENTDFKAEEKELMSTVNTIERAVTIIEQESGGASSLAQVKNMQSVTNALQAMVEAHAVSTADKTTLMSLVQSTSDSDEDEDSTGAPSAAAYESKSGTITDTLEGLLEKAEQQLDDARKVETQAMNAYQLQKQSLDDKIAFANKELAEAKKNMAATSETKATAEGDLQATTKDLKETKKDLEDLHHECMTEATAYEESTTSRGEELKALAEAKKIIASTTGDAEGQTYLAQTSFVQLAAKAKSKESNDLVQKAVNIVRRLATTQHSHALVQFASALERGTRSRDPFAKVKGLLNDMISKLMQEAEDSATKKAYCDKEMTETQTNKDDKEAQQEQLSTQIDVAAAATKKLKGQVATLEKQLGSLARTQAEMDKLRLEQKTVYEKNKPELEQGIKGVKTALTVLREYYAKDEKDAGAEDGGASSIIGLLEVCESDFSKGLAEVEAEEQASIDAYDQETKENEMTKASKEQDAKYKTKEYLALDKSITELKADKEGVTDELTAIDEYFAGIKKQCVAKPESYEERKARRESEIAGLKDALASLDGEAVLLQRSAVHRTLRGAAILQPVA